MTDSNFWGVNFSALTIRSIGDILKAQADLLPSLTDGAVSAELRKIEEDPLIDNSFIFRFNIVGKYVDNYRFPVCTFSHDISFYPAKMRLDSDIAKELKLDPNPFAIFLIEDEAKALELLQLILSSARLKRVISGIIKLTKADLEERPPF